jgi:hypothetical protein
MDVNISGVNERRQALIRSRDAVDAATLTDPETSLESLVAEEEPTDAS